MYAAARSGRRAFLHVVPVLFGVGIWRGSLRYALDFIFCEGDNSKDSRRSGRGSNSLPAAPSVHRPAPLSGGVSWVPYSLSSSADVLR